MTAMNEEGVGGGGSGQRSLPTGTGRGVCKDKAEGELQQAGTTGLGRALLRRYHHPGPTSTRIPLVIPKNVTGGLGKRSELRLLGMEEDFTKRKD